MKCSMEALNSLLSGALEATVEGEGVCDKIMLVE